MLKKFDLIFLRRQFNPTRLVVMSFGAVILLGTLLLRLPVASSDGVVRPWLTCLFTATSATCVTGLTVADTALSWSPFGQAVILVLIQLGGLGFVTVVTLISLLLHRRIGLSQRMLMASALNLDGLSGVVRLVRHALMGTVLLEGAGAVLLSAQFIPLFGWARGIWYGVFHSVSAFCNAGFDLFGGYTGPYSSLAGFAGRPGVLLTLSALIVLGGLGFFVWEDWLSCRSLRRLSLYSKLALGTTGVLILAGWLFFLCAEWDNPATLGALPPAQRVWNALFQSVTLRTAGYAVLDQGALTDSSGVLSILLMLIGGGSGSTAGGVKTVTFAVLLLALRDGLRGREAVVVRGRTIAQRKVLSAMTLSLLVLMAFLAGSMALSVAENLAFLPAAFETASALGTVGLSMGITPQLGWCGKLLVVGMMFLGRVGILSFSLAFLTRRDRGVKLSYPTAEVIIG